MTKDKKKPENDELKDEQLEDAAGGAAPKVVMDSLRVDGLPDGISSFPDVCKTPSPNGPVPMPYPTTSSSDGTTIDSSNTKPGKNVGG